MLLCPEKKSKNQQKNNPVKLSNNIENQNIQREIYKCPNCLIVPEIININYLENKILLECPFHKQKSILINDYLNSLKINICQICHKQILSNESSSYCYQCKNILCINCSLKHQKEHNKININEYNIKCQIHYNKNYEYYCFNCSSNLCEICFNNHDNKHNIIPLSNIFPQKDEIDFIHNKNKELNKIIQIYQNFISLNNLIIDTYNNYKNNFYYIKNIKSLIRFIKNIELSSKMNFDEQKNLQEQIAILEKFNNEFNKELNLDSDTIYLNWLNINKNSIESLTKIEFKKLKEFQSVGTEIDDISFLRCAKFPILQELYLTDNYISDISILEKVDFPMLKIIYLNKNKIKDINILSKVNFPELNKLFLDSNYISDISVFGKISFTNLENLKLSKNKICDISVFKNINLKYLRLLDIKKNEIDYKNKENLDIINDIRDKSIRIVY